MSDADHVHDHGAHDHGAHDHGAHDHGAHDHGAHDHGATDHGAHDHAATDHTDAERAAGDGDAGDCDGDDARACAEVLDALHAYLDAELDDPGLASIEAHLDACRRCGLEIDTYRRLKVAVRSSDNGLDPTVLSRLRRFAAELPRGTRLR